MINLEITFDIGYLDRLIQMIEEAPLVLFDVLERSVLPAMRRIAGSTLAVEPAVWGGGKRRWNSERQRRAFWASHGSFGRGPEYEYDPPYVRTHDLIHAWSLMLGLGNMSVDYGMLGPSPMGLAAAAGLDVKAGEGLTISLFNPSTSAVFVQGKWQQLMHMDTGWPTVMDTAQVIALEGQDLLAIGWQTGIAARFRQVKGL